MNASKIGHQWPFLWHIRRVAPGICVSWIHQYYYVMEEPNGQIPHIGVSEAADLTSLSAIGSDVDEVGEITDFLFLVTLERRNNGALCFQKRPRAPCMTDKCDYLGSPSLFPELIRPHFPASSLFQYARISSPSDGRPYVTSVL